MISSISALSCYLFQQRVLHADDVIMLSAALPAVNDEQCRLFVVQNTSVVFKVRLEGLGIL